MEIESMFLLGWSDWYPFQFMCGLVVVIMILAVIAVVLFHVVIARIMNMHPFKCSGCGKMLDAGNVPPGTRVQCPKCQAVSVTRTKWKKYN